MRRLPFVGLVLVAACASQPKPPPTPAIPKAEPVREQSRIVNQAFFDAAVCAPPAKSKLAVVNEAIIVGTLLAARPFVFECLVDPKNRGPAETTRVVVDSTVSDATAHAISGENLTEPGKQCIDAALTRSVQLPKSASPVKGHVEFEHRANILNAVKLGVNEPSDVAGNIRLAQATWCECYAGFETTVPPLMTAEVTLKKKGEPGIKVEGAQGGVQACFKDRIRSLQLVSKSDELTVPYVFGHVNSNAATVGGESSLRPDLHFAALEALRARRSAEAAIAVGLRESAATTYDASVQTFQQKKQPPKMLTELKTKCAALVAASTGVRDAFKVQLDVEEQTGSFAREASGKDKAWGEVAAAAQSKVDRAKKDLEAAEQQIKGDEAACPKVK